MARRTVAGLWKSSHPGPTLVVTALAAGLSVAAELDLWRIAVLTVAVCAGQLSIGISNDTMDAQRDRAVGRTDKPIARNEVTTATAWTASLVCLLLALGLSAPLGAGLLAAHAVVLASGWAYNAGLKAGRLSIAPYILAFGVFPSLATLASSEPQLAASWAWLTGGALGAALHLTNVLPDLDDDARTGVRGLPHRMGSGFWAAAAAAAAVLVGALAATAGPAGAELSEISALSWLVFGLVAALVLLTLGLARAGIAGRSLFRLVMLAALLLVAQLVASGQSLFG